MPSEQTAAGKYYDRKLEPTSSLPPRGPEREAFILRTFNLAVFNYNKIKEVERRLGMCECSGGHEAVDKKKVYDSQGAFSHFIQRDIGSLKRKPSKKKKKKKKVTKKKH